jgi:hypothetical protein
MKICLKYPTRERPTLFLKTLQRQIEYLSGKHEYQVVISCDEDDRTMNTPDMRAWISAHPFCEVFYNPPPQTKVSAINANIEGRDFDLLILCSDDMVVQTPGYDDRIATLLFQHFPDGDGVLHTNDGRTGKSLNTLAMMGREYYDRFGYIYHHSYRGLWCDNELQDVSERLHRSVYVDEVIFRHEWTTATGKDPLHCRNEAYYQTDAENFERRKAAGFP